MGDAVPTFTGLPVSGAKGAPDLTGLPVPMFTGLPVSGAKGDIVPDTIHSQS